MNKVRWGIMSTANIAKEKLIPAITKSASGEVYAVASRGVDKAKALAEECGIHQVHGSYEALLADPNVDAIYCPLPTGMHFEWAIKCLEAGKPLLCEKPITVLYREAKELLAAFEDKNLLISEAFMYRFHPLNLKVRELVRDGTIGDLRSIQSTFNVDMDRSNIRFNRELGGGALLDLGCYCVGISRFITGEEPIEVSSFAHIGEESNVDETRTGMLRFPNNVLASFTCSMTSAFECAYEVFGTKGRIRVQRGGMIPWPGESFGIELWVGDKFETISIPDSDHYALMVEAFNQSLMNDNSEVIPHSESLKNMLVLDQLRCGEDFLFE